MNTISNPIFRVVDFWVYSILGEYITKIAVDTIKSLSDMEIDFFQGPRGWYLISLNILIKIPVSEKGILRMESEKSIFVHGDLGYIVREV